MQHLGDKSMSTGWMAKRRPRTRGEASSHLGRPAALERCQSLDGKGSITIAIEPGRHYSNDTVNLYLQLARVFISVPARPQDHRSGQNNYPQAQHQDARRESHTEADDTRVLLAAQAEVNSRRKGFIRAQASQTDTGIAALRQHVYDCNGAWE